MHILLVDDEKLNRMVVGRVLKTAGFDFHSCAGGEEALEYLQRTPCDIVLMDRQMPGMDGLEATRRIRAMTHIRQPRIISFSAYIDERDQNEAYEAGMDGVIEKPVTIDQLRRYLGDPPGS